MTCTFTQVKNLDTYFIPSWTDTVYNVLYIMSIFSAIFLKYKMLYISTEHTHVWYQLKFFLYVQTFKISTKQVLFSIRSCYVIWDT